LGIFDKRAAFKPFEYAEISKFKDAISHSFWLVSEFNFTSDIHDFHTKLTPVERNAIKNALLAISQIEISVKRFWTKLGDRFPKAEFEQVGVTFGESEVRHADAYSHLLQVLGLNDDFTMLLQEPVIQGRVDYLTKYLKGAAASSNEAYTLTLTLFSLFVENVSLFSQFAIIQAYKRQRNLLKDIDNVVQATQKEEQIHALFGAEIINLIRKENPDWFTEEFYAKISRACKKAYEAEMGIIDWIFSAGEVDFISRLSLKAFIKDRFNQSVRMIGGNDVFDVDAEQLAKMKWFDEAMATQTSIDFFNIKSTAYSKRTKSITEDDLF
jgi:ribonucleoside-diphosphate reductase beta chain